MNIAECGDWMITYTGRRFYPAAPRAQDVCLEEIAHALSLICRFGGHTREFYSVAQHSVLVSQHLPEALVPDGLFHDAAEAYLGDVIRPLKPSLPSFSSLEARVMRAITDALGLSRIYAPQVKRIDLRAVLTEGQQLTIDGAASWGDEWRKVRPLPTVIFPLGPKEAEAAFLERAQGLAALALAEKATCKESLQVQEEMKA